MKKYFLITSAFFNIFLFSCKETPKTEAPTQMQRVLAVHDEVMPKMGYMGQLIAQLDDKIEETDTPEAYMEAGEDLREANIAMNDWMKNFVDSFDPEETRKGKALTEEKQKLLNEEEKKVEALRDQINTSIENAENLLK
tara:strand:- start:4013 stop:4429 length:417 start_codon:yes stop_codon:yes gene_type:complete